jgi:hypothetical protein
VTVWDEDEARREAAPGLTVEDPSTRDWSDLALLVVGESAMLGDNVTIRAIELARALDIPVHCPAGLFAEAASQEAGVKICAFVGGRARQSAEMVAALLAEAGADCAGPDLQGRVKPLTRGVVCLLAFEDGAALTAPPDLMVVGEIAETEARAIKPLIERMSGPVVLNADHAPARRLAMSAQNRAILTSGRQALAGGVFAKACKLFDGLDGPPRQMAPLGAETALGFAPQSAIAMAWAVLRKLNYAPERLRDLLPRFTGIPGQGRPIARLGPIALLDWSSAQTVRDALEALRAPGPVIWIAGPSIDPGAAALIEAAGCVPNAVFLTGDRRRAARKLARLCPTRTTGDTGALLARALHAALIAGPDARIVYAPACRPDVESEEVKALSAAMAQLARLLREGEAA